jgi:hypothetical protein
MKGLNMNRFAEIIVTGVAALVLAGPGTATAADKGHEHRNHKSHHGGVVVEIGHAEYELVAKPDVVTLYIYDDEKPVSTKGANASLALTSGSDKSSIKLDPAGDNKLEAKGSFKVAPGTRVLATITLEGKKPQQVRFMLK